jgi:hypothetical protein
MSSTLADESDARASSALLGAELYEVVFVRDYIQLGFEPAIGSINLTLTILTSLRVRIPDGRVEGAQLEPAAIISRINSTVHSAVVQRGKVIDLGLSDGAAILISLLAQELAGPEAATLRAGNLLWVWRPDDIGGH